MLGIDFLCVQSVAAGQRDDGTVTDETAWKPLRRPRRGRWQMVFGLFLTLFGLGTLCVLLYNCLVYALPFAIAVWATFAAIHLGAGPVAGIAIGCFVGGACYGVCELLLGVTHSTAIRILVIAVFVVPAVIAGYGAGEEISWLAISSSVWQHIYAVIGALSVGGTALLRLTSPQRPV